MTHVPFKSADARWYWAPEFDFRILADGRAVDAINLVADVFYQIPVKLTSENIPTAKKMTNWRSAYYMSKYETNDFESYEPLEITFTGAVIDRTWMAFLTSQVVHTGAADPFSHTYDSASATVKSNPPRTIALLCIEPNDFAGGSITKITMFTGGVLKHYDEGAETNGIVEGTWKVLVANEVDGVAPTTPTAYTVTEFFTFGGFDTIVYSKGATTYQMVFKSYNFNFDTDQGHDIGGSSYYAIDSIAANKIDVYLDLDFEIKDKAIMAATDEDTNTAHDKTVTVKSKRSATDYFSISFVKAFVKFEEKLRTDGNLHLKVKVKLNPKETGFKLLMVEMNALASTRY